MKGILDFLKKLYYDKRIRFLFVGVLNTIVGVGSTLLVYYAFGYPLFAEKELDTLAMVVGTLTGQIIGTVHSYFWNKYFTFRSKKKSVAEFFRFVLVYAVQYFVNLALTALFNIWISIPALVTGLTVLVCTILSYFGHSLFSFRSADKDKSTKDLSPRENVEDGNGDSKTDDADTNIKKDI